VDPLPRRMRAGCVAATLLLIGLACNLPLPSADVLPSTDVGQPASQPSGVPEAAGVEPVLVAQVDSEFHLYSLEGALLGSRPADGLDFARPNTAQVIGQDIYYVFSDPQAQTSVVRRVGPTETEDLEFTQSSQGASLAFTVSPEGERIAWSSTAWEGAAPVSQLRIADIRGEGTLLVAETDPKDEINEWFVLEPVEWLADGDLVFAWQATGIGGYILFHGWSSLYQYSPASDTTDAIAPVQEEVGAPCWTDLSQDGAYAAGACGPESEVIELNVASGLETPLPVLPAQGQAGTAAYSPSGGGLAYAIARSDPEDEAGQVVVRSGGGQMPAVVATQAPGYFERLIWIDEQRMAVGTWAEAEARVEVVGLDGSRSPVGAGRLVGIMRRADQVAEDSLQSQIERGELDLQANTATGDIGGPGLTLVVYNPGQEEVLTLIPCGSVFAPTGGGAQQLMTVQESRASVPAGGETTLTAYVICIEANQSIPGEGTPYVFSSMADGTLGEFAACVCRENLQDSMNPLDAMSVQMAGWMITEGGGFSELLESDSGGALGEFLGSEAASALSGFLGFVEGPALDRLERCGIEP